MRWAHENDCPWNEYTCTMAAFGGHLEVLQWARAHDCPWSEATCWWAAEHDRLEILKWALANGAPFDGDTGRKLREWSLI